MIEKKTLLVLGAGASAHLDFPCGPGLRRTIIEVVGDDVLGPAFDPERVGAFRRAFLQSGVNSIDEFLEHRHEYLTIGKAAIAFILIRCEVMSRLHDFLREHWYQHLLHAMRAPKFEDIEHNNLAIITFNYDRSLEVYLTLAWQHQWGRSLKDVAALLKAFPIIHVHGKLGELPWMAPEGKRSRDYDQKTDPEQLDIAVTDMAIVHEEQSGETKSQIGNLMHWAERIYFLGLGYDPYNMTKLGLPFKYGSHGQMWGTSYKLTMMEAEAVEEKYDIELYFKKNSAVHGHACLEWLRHWVRLN